MGDWTTRPINTTVNVCYDMTSHPDMLTEKELEAVTTAFKTFETGVREATIYPKDLQKAMQMVGLNPDEQEVIDIPNELARAGLIYFPDFCTVVLERLRQSKEEEEDFYQYMFKMMCGTEPYPTDFKAKKYKLSKHALTKEDFTHIMKNLPVAVPDEDIEEMFDYADKDKNGKLSYKEFEVMIRPRAPPARPKPHITDIGMKPQTFSPPTPQEAPSNYASPLLPDRSSRSSFCSTSTHTSRKFTSKTGSTKSSESGSKTDISRV